MKPGNLLKKPIDYSLCINNANAQKHVIPASEARRESFLEKRFRTSRNDGKTTTVRAYTQTLITLKLLRYANIYKK
ncbi:hypothetical protein BMS3Abin06_00158 [bacterium BMS3Abin06]|nr:hypothetical protein BMS3Abin06_00158 [bacterium BMS3Abin06]